MALNWIPRLAQALAALYDATSVCTDAAPRGGDTRNTDTCNSELEAIRLRFPDHA